MKVFKVLLSALMIISLSVPPAFADEVMELKQLILKMKDDYEQRIGMLEKKIETLEASQENQNQIQSAQIRREIEETMEEKSMNIEYRGRDHSSFDKGGLMVEAPSGNSHVTLGGYMDHEFENFENSDSSFDQHRWIINIGAQLGERLRFFSEYEIEHGGPNASGSGEAKVEQAWVDFLINDLVNFRGGAVLVPFGRTNIYHDSDMRDLTDRPLVARDIIPSTWTESGVGFHGEANPAIGDFEDLLVNYEFYVINGLNDGFSDTGLRGARGSLSSDNNNSKALVGRVVLSPAIGQEIGFSGYWGKYNDFGDSISGKAVDVMSVWGPLELIAEYAYFDAETPDFAATGISDIAETFEGLRLQFNYHFWPEFLNDTFLAKSFTDPTFTFVGRYDWAKIDDDSDAGVGDNEEDRFTVGLNYRPLESWVFKIEYQWNDTDNESLEHGKDDGFLWSIAMGF